MTQEISGVTWFTPKTQTEKPEDQRIRFKIRGLIGTEAMDVNFHSDDDGRMSMTARGGNACLRCGLLDWENVLNRDGKPLEFNAKEWKESIATLNPVDVVELALAVWNRTFQTEDARKN